MKKELELVEQILFNKATSSVYRKNDIQELGDRISEICGKNDIVPLLIKYSLSVSGGKITSKVRTELKKLIEGVVKIEEGGDYHSYIKDGVLYSDDVSLCADADSLVERVTDLAGVKSPLRKFINTCELGPNMFSLEQLEGFVELIDFGCISVAQVIRALGYIVLEQFQGSGVSNLVFSVGTAGYVSYDIEEDRCYTTKNAIEFSVCRKQNLPLPVEEDIKYIWRE